MNRCRHSVPGGILPAMVVGLALAAIAVAVWFWMASSVGNAGSANPANGSASATPPSTTASQVTAPGNAAQPPDVPNSSPADIATTKTPPETPEPAASKLANFDKRFKQAAEPSAGQKRALQGIRRQIPGIDVQFDPVTASPSHINAVGRFLTGGAPPGADVHEPVRQFIDDHAALFGHRADVLTAARLTREDVTARSGLRTVVWQQEIDGIPVYNTILKANLSRDGALVSLGSHFMRDPTAATGLDPAGRATLAAQPPVDARRAVSLAAAHLNDVVAPEQVVEVSRPEGAEQKQRFDAPQLSDTVTQLSWLPMNADTARLAWDVTLMSLKRNEMFRIVVDAKTGEVLKRTSLTADISNASFRVYADGSTRQPFDSPTPFSPGHSTPQSTPPAEVSRNLITLQAIDLGASPNGWINDGDTETFGNNVDAHLDLPNINPAYGSGTHAASATRVFDFPLDLMQEPTTTNYRSAALTNLFYLCNWYHDQLYILGFTESSGNFQQENFGRGGMGGDAVLADAQDGGGANNANFSTPSDGSPGRMQMYVFSGSAPDRDGDLDAEIVFHEHTHGLSNRLVGGGVGISSFQSSGMGEGWSDFYALCLLSQPGDDVNGNYAAGAYVTDHFFGETENYYYGIRRYPYSTNLSKNPLTLKDIDPSQASPHNGIPYNFVFGAPNSNPSEVHMQGEVWCVTLWEARANLINKLGAAAGNETILQLVTDGMKLAPVDPTFLQARDAIIQADLAGYGGANRNELWAAFAKRGMGFSATVPPSSTTTGVVEAYDLPDYLDVSPAGPLVFTGETGGPFSPGSFQFTLKNYGTGTLNWTATDDATWLDLGTASGSLAPGASTTVTATVNSAANSFSNGLYGAGVIFTNTGSGKTFTRSINLRVGPIDYFTEIFDTSPHDISNQSFLFTPNVSESGYSALRIPVAGFYTDPAGGTALPMSDDTSVQVTLTGGQQVQLYGASYASFYVGSNGYITFGLPDTQYSETSANHFGFPRVAALMDDLLPSTGQVTWKQTADRVAVTWLGVPEYGMSTSNNFQIELFFDGRIRITNLAIAASDGLIGLSRGTGVPPDFVESDFSAYPTSQLALSVAASASEGAAPLAATLTASPAPGSDLIVNLTSSNAGAATVPATATILAGQTTASFSVTIVDDALLDGAQNTVLTAAAPGFATAYSALTVLDNELATLGVSAPATTTEGVGTVSGTVSVSTAPGTAVNVTLSSSDPAAVQVPPTITIPSGQTTADFTIIIVDDTKINGPHSATITAHVANWTDGTATLEVQDNENTNLSLTVPPKMVEGSSGNGNVSISGTLPAPLTVSLASTNNARLAAPATVTIAAGSTSASFSLSATENALLDGTESVTISAGASGFTGMGSSVNVSDNDAHHYAFSTIPASQNQGVPFSVTLSALDANDVPLANYAGSPSLSAAGSGGIESISPILAGGFVNGVWTGNVTINTQDSNVVLTAADDGGHTGSSNAFNVGPAPDCFTELFDNPEINDTDNQSWLFTPHAIPSFYSVVRTASVNSFPTDPSGGTPVSLTDDSFAAVTLSGGAQVKLYGVSYSTFYIGSNGYVTFGSGDYEYSESIADHFNRPRISALFDDLDPGGSGAVTWKQLADRAVVTWQNVAEYSTTNSNSFQIELFFDGRIRITCLGIAATSSLIGLSRGLDVPAGFAESDFSSYDTYPPVVATAPATAVLSTSATLNCTVNPNGQATTAQFEYGLTTAYGSFAGVNLSPNDSPNAQAAGTNLTDLSPGATYHFRAIAANPGGTVYGSDMTFTTLTLQENWRLDHFGTTANTGDAADAADPDGDGESNGFEYAAGLTPTDPVSRLRMRVESVPGQPGQKAVVFSPIVPGRNYIVKSKGSLSDPTWSALANFSTSDNNDERTVIDLAADGGTKFYIVEITAP